MIVYKEEKKKLVIPSGFVMIPIECDEAIEQAREQGYQEGFADGSSATCDTEEGTYSLTDDFDGEETVFPSEGKTGFNKIVIVDDGYGDKKYDEGVESQKGKLESITFTRNGDYTKEDGWSAVTVDVPNDINLGTLVEAPQMSDISYDYYIQTFDPQQSSVDGWGEIRLYMGTLIAESKNEQKALMSAATFTQNGVYRREDGWNEIEVNVPQTGSSCNLQSKPVVVSANTQTVSPDQGYDGMSSVSIDATSFGENKYQQGYEAGYDSGYEDAEEDYPRIQPQKNYTADTTSFVIVPDTHYDAMGMVSVNATPVFNQGYQSGLTACSGGTCLIEDEQTASLGYDWTGFTTVYPSQGYDGLSSVIVADLGYGQRKYDEGYAEGYNEAITANCGSAITEAYESGVTVGYIDSNKLAYFNTPAWVETTNPQFLEVGDILDMVFVTGEMGDTLHLLGNLNSGYTEIEYEGGPGIAIDYPNAGGLRITMFNADGFRHIWTPFYSVSPTICRFSGDTYHLIFKTTLPDSYGRMYMQVTLINESRFNDVYSASATGETIHFSSGATNPFVINGVYDENSGLYGEMNSELKIKSLKVYKPVGPHIANPDLNRLSANLLYKDGQFFDVASGGEYGAYIYDNGEAVPYHLPSADDELYTIW